MVIGVTGFYFIIGGITSVISHAAKKKAIFRNHIHSLLRIKKKYKLGDDLYQIALGLIYKKDYKNQKEKYTELINKFPRKLKTELKFSMYTSILSNFRFTKHTPPANLIMIGESIKRVHVRKSRPDKTSSFTWPGSPRTKSTS